MVVRAQEACIEKHDARLREFFNDRWLTERSSLVSSLNIAYTKSKMVRYVSNASKSTSTAALTLSLITLFILIVVVLVATIPFFSKSRTYHEADTKFPTVDTWWIAGEETRHHLRTQSEADNLTYDRWNLFVYERVANQDIAGAIDYSRDLFRRRRPDIVALGSVREPNSNESQLPNVPPDDRWKQTYWNLMSLQRPVAYRQGYWEIRDAKNYNGLSMSFAQATATALRYDADSKIQCSMFVRECKRIRDGQPFLYVQFDQQFCDESMQRDGAQQLLGMLVKLDALYPFESWHMIIVGGFGVHGADRIIDETLNTKFMKSTGNGYHVPQFYRWITYNGDAGIVANDAIAVSRTLYPRAEFFVDFAETWNSPSSAIGVRCFDKVDDDLQGTYDVTSDSYRRYVDAVQQNATKMNRKNVRIGQRPDYDPTNIPNIVTTLKPMDTEYKAPQETKPTTVA